MPAEGDSLVLCYNRGCGQKFDPSNNNDDSCRHHPGAPFFHDAYKGWSCCNKKCTDFTEFLNVKGCTLSRHSNIKPPEPEKPKLENEDDLAQEVNEVKPVAPSRLERPAYETPMVIMKPEIATSLKKLLDNTNDVAITKSVTVDNDVISIGTVCKNNGCNETYDGPSTNNTSCIHHPGVPIFHEGLKFWSCCQKRTSDFNAFLSQAGCETGSHVWKKEEVDSTVIQCRWDWHQTGTHVIVSVYAKNYCPNNSIVQLSPVRLCVKLVFPQQANAEFNLDMELRGIVNVDASQVSMLGTKVEIKLKKAEPGSWINLDFPKPAPVVEPKPEPKIESITPQLEDVDLSDL